MIGLQIGVLLKIGGTSRLLQQSPRRSEGVTAAYQRLLREERLSFHKAPAEARESRPLDGAIVATSDQPSTKPPQKRGSHSAKLATKPSSPSSLQQSPRRSEGVTSQRQGLRDCGGRPFNKAPAEARESLRRSQTGPANAGPPSTKPPQKRGSHIYEYGPRKFLVKPSTKPPQKRGSHKLRSSSK